MGWKASTIIVHKPKQVENEELLKELGFKNLRITEKEPFEVAINPSENKVYVGTYKDNLLICAQDIPMKFFEDKETSIEKILNRLFPDSEICSIVLHSTVNLWGFSVTKNGQKIRARAGSSDDGTFYEFGEPLEEEQELLSKSTINKNGQRTYSFEGIDEEPMTEDQVGENFVFAICKRYFGKELDSAEDLLFETNLDGYLFGKVTAEENKKGQSKFTQPVTDGKPWWKFW